MTRTILAGGILFAVLSFAVHESGLADIRFHPASHQPGDASEIAQPLPTNGKLSARAFDQAHQTLRPDGTRQSPMAWP
ncbi:hypothetical protein TSH100_26535 [Azospirillum sp. TSH100]|nr:hypothetical protein [Azospirillum sp. TSH100]PWC81742.1 hypothetical protein TSH100_26535 [Azospirillum sp. TSH100]QCG89012.1 hypothetical protein E6C72_14400 [Azospirillum sp. TSH100]